MTDQKPQEKRLSDFGSKEGTMTSEFMIQDQPSTKASDNIPLRGRSDQYVPRDNSKQGNGSQRRPLGNFQSREREITTLMKWPEGRPGLDGNNVHRNAQLSNQKPINIRRRDVSEDVHGVAMTELQRDRKQQFKVDKSGPHIPPRPGQR